MRTVLYTEDLQPIAIVELTPSEEEIITHGGIIKLAVRSPVEIVRYPERAPIPRTPILPQEVEIHGEWVKRKNTPQIILLTCDTSFKPQPALRLSELSL